MPPTNPARRRALADTAIALLASSGVHGVTHRAVEKAAGVPPGTASNYFRSREALLVAAAERVAELHHAEQAEAVERPAALAVRPAAPAELLTDSLFTAATTLRDRYLAIFELRLEATRSPALASALAGLAATAEHITVGQHETLGLTVPRERIPILIALYSGALFTLVGLPPGAVTRDVVRDLVEAMLSGCAG
ncbi:TetR/AcrR family transcriptional regulator [Spongiactinospora sp. TRM90649]|uniref:TetR/AcrR family transcriptional regulator n=1 Tax=Spongiactinospora sp. TRM90649 TaxID=3031114 RepID=UPI0023F9AFC1|nr:TetR/AcrR family transcriptional regulator [Spongiactinospora sp. TRM90649]MDF5753594.1 TetR family transcriptional regulator [Spongiactinospora sp. TRM90649]